MCIGALCDRRWCAPVRSPGRGFRTCRRHSPSPPPRRHPASAARSPPLSSPNAAAGSFAGSLSLPGQPDCRSTPPGCSIRPSPSLGAPRSPRRPSGTRAHPHLNRDRWPRRRGTRSPSSEPESERSENHLG